MLTKDDLEFYKTKLLENKKALLSEIEEYSRPENFGDDIEGPGEEEADEAEELGNRLATAQILKERVNQIDKALNKIESGTYGICEKCGGEISKEILNVDPESVLCENCK